MKKIYLLFVFHVVHLYSFAQRTDVQIDLVNNNVSVPTGTMQGSYGTQTSDAGLNTIFQNHNISSCYMGIGHPVTSNNIIMACYSGTNINAFVNDIRNYALVQKVSICPQIETFGDVLYSRLVNNTIGIPTSVDSNGIIITNDAGLNTIFQNYLVKTFRQTFPSSTWDINLRTYTLMCDGCNITNLKNTLNSYTSIIEYNEFVPTIFLTLNRNELDKSRTRIFPNPFSDVFSISSEENIKNITVFNILGKQNLYSVDKEKIQKLILQLENGIYFLRIELENGETSTYKIVKR